MNNEHEHPHLEVNEISTKTKASMHTRIVAAIVMIATIIPAVFLGGWIFFVLLLSAISFAVYEMICATKKKYRWYVWVFTYLAVFSYIYWFVLKANFLEYQMCKAAGESFSFSLENYYSGIQISPISMAVALGVYSLIGVLDKDFDFADVAYFMFVTLLLGLGFQSFFFLRYYPFYMFAHNDNFSSIEWLPSCTGKGLLDLWQFRYFWSVVLFFMMLASATLSDAFAYFGGVFFGKHKMNPRISPNKTWEGFWFGVIGGILSTFAIGISMAAAGYPVLPTLDLAHWYWILILAIVGTIVGVLGDLTLSMIKRHYGVKDYGTLIPGHGGVMDRIDSNIFTSIGMAVILIFITNGWNFAL